MFISAVHTQNKEEQIEKKAKVYLNKMMNVDYRFTFKKVILVFSIVWLKPE